MFGGIVHALLDQAIDRNGQFFIQRLLIDVGKDVIGDTAPHQLADNIRRFQGTAQAQIIEYTWPQAMHQFARHAVHRGRDRLHGRQHTIHFFAIETLAQHAEINPQCGCLLPNTIV